MKILTADVGTGTQDILLFDDEQLIENSIQLVMPSPTVLVAEQIRAATHAREAVLLTGVTMGGGPCHWAATDHLRRGLAVYATADAARTFDDDLEQVAAMGVTLVAEDEVRGLPGVRRLELRDFYLDAIVAALRAFGVEPRFAAVAVAVFDHGAAPPGVSDRAFRFDYLARRLRQGPGLAGFAYQANRVPEAMTRLRAVAQTYTGEAPLLVMDTGPAAILGALEDPRLASPSSALVANLGNFHTLAFHLSGGEVAGLFEHHTGELSAAELETYLDRLGAGTITNEEVFADQGHGALVLDANAPEPNLVGVVGPRRRLLAGSRLHPYFAVPHGDMMLTGCFGLLRALQVQMPEFAEAIARGLDQQGDEGGLEHRH